MKPIESKLKTHPKTWLTPVLLIAIACFAVAMVSPVNSAPPDPCVTGGFCDQDGDGWIRNHKKCGACGGSTDPDDNNCFIPDEEGCGSSGGGDDGYIQTNLSNAVIWGKDMEGVQDLGFPYETDPEGLPTTRNCGPGSEDPVSNPNPQGLIQYVCHSDADFLYGRESWNTVFLDLSALTPGDQLGDLNPSGRDPGLCTLWLGSFVENASGLAIRPKKEQDECNLHDLDCIAGVDDPLNVGRHADVAYHFGVYEGNDESCTYYSNPDNSCKVKIFTQGYFYNWKPDCDGSKCGRRIGMEAYGRVDPAPGVSGQPAEINPFTQDQVINIEELTVFFMGIGTNRLEASCYYDNRIYDDGEWTGEYLSEDLVFRTCVDMDEGGVCDSREPLP